MIPGNPRRRLLAASIASVSGAIGLAIAALVLWPAPLHGGFVFSSEYRPPSGFVADVLLGSAIGATLVSALLLAMALRWRRTREAAKPRSDRGAAARGGFPVAGIVAARGLAHVAAWMAGSQRAHLREAWLGDLRSTAAPRALRAGTGYLIAAVTLRLQDAARPLARALDAVLISATRTRCVIGAALAALAGWLLADQGLSLTIGDVVAFPILWGALDKSAAWLRHVRGLPDSGTRVESPPADPADHLPGQSAQASDDDPPRPGAGSGGTC